MLRAAGIEVDGPVLEAAAKQLIAPFLARRAAPRPYVTLKWAQTADGKVAGPGGRAACRSATPTSTRAGPRAAAPVRRDPGRHQHGAQRRPAADRPRRAEPARTTTSGRARPPPANCRSTAELVRTARTTTPVVVYCSSDARSQRRRDATLAESTASSRRAVPIGDDRRLSLRRRARRTCSSGRDPPARRARPDARAALLPRAAGRPRCGSSVAE